MELIEKIQADLKEILSERRYTHSIGVMEMAGELAKIYGVDIETAKLAGLLHDNAKEISDEEMLKYVEENNIEINEFEKHNVKILHGKVGADIAKKKYGVNEKIQKARSRVCHASGERNRPCIHDLRMVLDEHHGHGRYHGCFGHCAHQPADLRHQQRH